MNRCLSTGWLRSALVTWSEIEPCACDTCSNNVFGDKPTQACSSKAATYTLLSCWVSVPESTHAALCRVDGLRYGDLVLYPVHCDALWPLDRQAECPRPHSLHVVGEHQLTMVHTAWPSGTCAQTRWHGNYFAPVASGPRLCEMQHAITQTNVAHSMAVLVDHTGQRTTGTGVVLIPIRGGSVPARERQWRG